MVKPAPTSGLDAWLAQVSANGAVLNPDRAALLRHAVDVQTFTAREVLAPRGEKPRYAFLVLQGLLARRKETALGSRQITSIFVAGDLVDGAITLRLGADHEIVGLSDGAVARIPETALEELEAGDAAAPAIRRAAAYETAISREWVVNIGARDAVSRVSHLLCELIWRLRRAGLTHDHACALPLRQQDIADATGISAVHVNRVLQRLRRSALIRLVGDRLEILDAERLEELADFEPDYLEGATAQQASGADEPSHA